MPYDAAYYEARITTVQSAIDAVMLGQSYEIDGRKMTRANLGDLTKLLTYYRGEYDGLTNRATFARSRVIVPRG